MDTNKKPIIQFNSFQFHYFSQAEPTLHDINLTIYEGEKVLIQGIIDVFFIENGEIVLLDYKTDVIDSLQALWNRYSVQIQYYEEALTKLMQLPVKERILYSFYLEKYE